MGDEHIVQPRPVILDKLQPAIQSVGGLENRGEGLLGRVDPDIQAGRRRLDCPHRGLSRQRSDQCGDLRQVLQGHGHDIAAQPYLQLSRRSERLDGSLVDDGQPVAELVRLIQIIRRHHDRHAAPLQHPHVVPNSEPALHIQPQRGLVEKQDLGVRQETTGNVEFPLHSSGVGFRRTIGRFFQFHELQQLGNALRGFSLRQVIQRAKEFEVFSAGEKAVNGPFLRHVTDQAPDDIRLAHRIVA